MAKQLLNDCGCDELPVNLEKIADYKKIKLVKHDFGEDVYGVLIMKDGKYTIGYEKNNSPVRQRFTIAHELGHFILGHNKDGVNIDTITKNYQSLPTVLFRNNDSSTGEFIQEREANAFAAALLMPQDLLIEKFESRRFSRDFSMEGFAKEFNVSTQAMAYRLDKLGLLDKMPL